MALNLLGLLCVSIFYFLSVLFGFCAYRCLRKATSHERGQIPRTRSNVTEIQAFPYSDVMSAMSSAGVAVNVRSDGLWETEKVTVVSPLRPLDSLSETSDEDGEGSSLPPGGRFFLADGSIGWIIGSTSLLATRAGGLFTNATAQEAYTGGLIWCLLPVSFLISVALSCIFYSNMPKNTLITAGDWFQSSYGRRTGAVFAVPVIVAELAIACVVMGYISYGMENALGVNSWVSSLLSAFTIFICLCASGLYASLISDTLQLLFLWIAVVTICGGAEKLPSTRLLSQRGILGMVEGEEIGSFLDHLMVLSIGCVPLQSNYQRIAPMLKRQNYIKILIVIFLGTVVITVPSILLGLKAQKHDWKNTTGSRPSLTGSLPSVIPQLFMSTALSGDAAKVVVTGALSAGMLASCDSSIFAATTSFCQNIFKGWFRPQACEKDLIIVARLTILGFTLVAALPAALKLDIHRCWLLPFDIMAVSVFPQLFCITYLDTVNTYGAVSGFAAGTLLRIFLGDQTIRLPAILQLPFGDPAKGPLLPFRTTCILVSLIVTITVSVAYQWLYDRNKVASVHDIFLCFMSAEEKRQKRTEESNERVQKITVI